jgi:hypothetical protein
LTIILRSKSLSLAIFATSALTLAKANFTANNLNEGTEKSANNTHEDVESYMVVVGMLTLGCIGLVAYNIWAHRAFVCSSVEVEEREPVAVQVLQVINPVIEPVIEPPQTMEPPQEPLNF